MFGERGFMEGRNAFLFFLSVDAVVSVGEGLPLVRLSLLIY